MMKAEKSQRTRKIGFRITPEEYTKIEKRWKDSDCQRISDYIRDCLFNKPITTTYRNMSIDELMAEVIVLHRELNLIRNKFSSAIKEMYILQSTDEFRNWSSIYHLDRKILFDKIEIIKALVQKMVELWLQ